jgi:hypothetical protein
MCMHINLPALAFQIDRPDYVHTLHVNEGESSDAMHVHTTMYCTCTLLAIA